MLPCLLFAILLSLIQQASADLVRGRNMSGTGKAIHHRSLAVIRSLEESSGWSHPVVCFFFFSPPSYLYPTASIPHSLPGQPNPSQRPYNRHSHFQLPPCLLCPFPPHYSSASKRTQVQPEKVRYGSPLYWGWERTALQGSRAVSTRVRIRADAEPSWGGTLQVVNPRT